MKRPPVRDSLMFRGDEYYVNAALTLWCGSDWPAGTYLLGQLERASGIGTCGVSLRGARVERPGTRGRDPVTGTFTNVMPGRFYNQKQKRAEISKNSAWSRRRKHLIREEMIGHDMRAGLGNGRGRIVCVMGGSTLGFFQQPAREHRAGVFIEPLIEQRSHFLAKVGGMA